jgi:hypothetical protein
VRARGGVRAAALTLVVAVAGCGGGGEPAAPPERGARPAAPADARAPDRVGALTGAGRGGTFACRTGGAMLLRLADGEGVTLAARGQPLAFGGTRTLLVRRDCRRVARAPHPFSRLTGRRWRGPRLSVTWRAATLRCRTRRTVRVSLARQRPQEPARLSAAPEGTTTEAFILDADDGGLVAIVWVAPRGSRIVSTPACRRA